MKKISGIVLSFVLILECLTGALAEEKSGWSIIYRGTGNTDRDTYFVSISEEYAHTGTNGMRIKYNPSSYKAENYAEIKNTFAAPLETGKYTLSFYNYGDTSKFTKIKVGNDVTLGITQKAENCTAIMTAGEPENGWTKYSAEFDYTAGSGDFVSFCFYKGAITEAIDDVVLSKVENGVNLIEDSGFENFGEDSVVEDEEEYDTTDYLPKSMLASPHPQSITLNWINPATSDLKAIKIYDITGGKEELLTDTTSSDKIAATPGKRMYYTISGLTNGTKYQYKAVFSYKTKAAREYYLTGSPKHLSAVTFGNWKLEYITNDTAAHLPGEITIDNNVYHGDSGASLKIVSNIDRTRKEYASGTFFYLQNNFTVEPSTKYKITMFVKTDKLENGVKVMHNWAKFDGKESDLDKSFVGTTDGWKEVTYEFTTSATQTSCQFHINLEDPCVAMWIDDVTCVKADDETGENILKNGDFESIASDTVGSFKSVTAEAGYNEGTIKIGVPTADYAGAEIYKKVFDKYEYRGTLASNISELKMTGIEGEKEYAFKLVPFNDDNVCGTPAEVSFTPLVLDYDIGDIVLSKNGTEVDKIDASGTYNLSVSAKNNKVEGGFKYEQFAALYDGNKLVGVFSTENTVPKKASSASYTKTSTVINVPEEDGDYKLKVFIIDARESFNMYLEPVEF